MNRREPLLLLATGVAILLAGSSSCTRTQRTELPTASATADSGPANRASEDAYVSYDVPPKPDAYSVHVDINSGDYRRNEYSSGQLFSSTIFETPLSKELRRVGVAIPPERQWRLISGTGTSGLHADGGYAFVMPAATALVRLLNDVAATDEERREVLSRFMATLRTQSWYDARDCADLLIKEVMDRHGKGMTH